jgi:hypothetical protein
VGARGGPEGQDEGDEHPGRADGVLEQLQSRVVAEPLGHDPRTDNRSHEECGAGELGSQAARQR